MTTRIAIIGSNGYIGKELTKTLQRESIEVLPIDKISKPEISYLDLTEPQSFNYTALEECQLIIFTAAISSPDFCTDHFEESYQVNVTGTKYFINKVLENNQKVLFFSSDAVFGNDSQIFYEHSETHANTNYGVMKKEIEDTFKSNKLFKAIRLSYVLSKNDKFLNYLFACKKNGQVAEIFHPFYRNIVTLNDVTTSIMWLINNWEDFDSSFLNICGNELVCRIQIVDELNRFLDQKIEYSITFPDDGFFVKRPQITEMKSNYLRDILKDSDVSFSSKIKNQLKLQ